MAATTLSAGDIAIIGYNTEDSGNPQRDSISFVLLRAIGQDTTIYFSDRNWNGTAFPGASAVEGTYTYVASLDLPAGTVITITQAMLGAGTIDLSDVGETIYAYQGTGPNAPGTFLYAVDVADENTTFNGNLTGTGLSAAAFTAVAIGADNASFGTRGYNIQLPDLRSQIANPTDWVQNTNSPQVAQLQGGGNFATAPDKMIWVAGSGGGESISMISLDSTVGSGNLGYQLMQAFQNDLSLYHPSDLTLDTVHDRFFMIDADLAGNNRVVQGSISQVLANPGAPIVLTVLYSNAGSGATGSMRTLSLDTVNQKIYFDVGTTFNRINYNTPNQTKTQLADLIDKYVTQTTIDYVHGEVFLGTSSVTSFFGQDIVDNNYVYKASSLSATGANTSLTFAPINFNPDDDDAGGPNNPNIAGLFGEAWPVELGTIRGVDVDPSGRFLYIVTGTVILDTSAAQNGSQMTKFWGGVYKYDTNTTTNAAGNVTLLFKQDGVNGPKGLLYYIEVDPSTGKYYVADETGDNAVMGDGGIWVGNTNALNTPTLVSYIGNINGLGPQGLEIQDAPNLTGTSVGATITEAAGNPSPAPTAVQPANGFAGSDYDSDTAAVDQLAGGQVRISGNFLSGATHQDLLTIGGATSGISNGITFTYSQTTGVMTLTGITSIANYNTVLGLVRYSVTGDDPTSYGTTTTRTLSYSTFDGLLYSDEVNASVTVVGINDAPVNTISDRTVTEDSTNNTITGISIFDVDANPATQNMTVILGVNNGALTISTAVAGGVTAGMVTGNGTGSITIVATQNQINASLVSGLTYTPVGNFNGPATLTITTNDGGANGTDAGLSGTPTTEEDFDTKTITVTAVNDAPVVVNGTTEAAGAIYEDQPITTFTQTVGSLFSSHFSDALDQVSGGSSANLLAGIAVVTNNSGANGDWQYYNGTSWLNIGAASASASVLIAASTPIRFSPATNFNGAAPTLDVRLVDDSGGVLTSGSTANTASNGGTTRFSSATITLTETVNAVNDAPTATNLSGDSVTYIEGGAAVKLDVSANAVINDIDSANFDTGTLTVKVTTNAVAAQDLISIDGTFGTVTLSGANVLVGGITIGTYTGGTVGADLVVTFNANATPAAVSTLLRAIQYSNTNTGDPSSATRTVSFVLVDGDGVANSGTDTLSLTTTVGVTLVNDAPSGTDNAKTILEDANYTFALADFGFTDPTDGAAANSIQSVVFTTVPATGQLMYDADGPGGAAPFAITNGTEITAINIAFGRLVFVPAPDGNGAPYTSFTFQVRDDGGTANGGVNLDPTLNTFTINVTPVNDPSVVDLNGPVPAGTAYTNTFTEGTGAAQGAAVNIAAATATITDIDSALLSSVTITLTNPLAGDVLSINGALSGGVTTTGYNSGTGVLTLTGAATKSAYEAALRQVQYSNTSQDPSATARVISVVAIDAQGDSSISATSTITVVPVNDAPVLDLDANNSTTTGANFQGLYIPGGSAVAIVDTDRTITDVDSANLTSMTVRLTNFFAGDQLGNAGVALGLSASYDAGTNTATYSGSASLATYLQQLDLLRFSTFSSTPDTTPRVFEIRVYDGTDYSNFATSTITLNQPPSQPADANGSANSVTEGATANTLVGITASSTDPESGAITYSLSDNAGGRFQINATTGVVSVSAAGATTINYEDGGSYNITVVATDVQNGTNSQTFAINVVNVAPTTPVDSNGATNTVSESAVNGDTVGVTASASDVNGGTITYTLTDNANGRFAINATTGVVTVADAAQLNFEAATTHNITIHAADASGAFTSDTTVAIAVTNVAPTSAVDTNGAADTISESVTNGATVGITASSTDVHGGTVTYSLVNSAGGRFSINGTTGVVTVADASLINYETSTVHSITVRAADPSGAFSSDTQFTIDVTNVAPTTPVDSNAGTNTVSEGASNGDLVGVTGSSSDIHGGTITYSLADSAGGRFAINSSTGVVTVADASLLNFEANTTHNITVRASDGTAFSDQTFSIGVTNVAPSSPADTDGTANFIAESVVHGDAVGVTAHADDPNGGAITYSLVNNAGGRFAINASTGVVTVADASQINYESATSHQITVRAVDPSNTHSTDTIFTINVGNVAPTSPVDTDGGTGGNVTEGAANGTAVGVTASSTDVHGGTITYSLSNNAGGRFAINSSTGVVTVANAGQINYESNTTHTITVHAVDSSNTSSTDTDFTIAVNNVAPSAPVDSDAGANTVSEGATNGATVGVTGSASDINGGTITYSLSDNAGGRFTIDAGTGVVTVANASALDFETNMSHSITVRASDGTAFTDQTFSITVTNVAPTTPVDGNGAANTISEGAVNDDLVGITATSSDIHGGTVTFSLADNAGGRFKINASTGVVSVADATQLNYESNTSHSITVRASDGTGFTDQVFSIAVTDVAPVVPVDTDAGADTVSEGASNGATVGLTGFSTDVHGGTIVYSLADSASGRFAIDSSTGVVTVANAALLNYESATQHTIVVRASDGVLFSQQSFDIGVTNVAPTTPVDSNAGANTVSEGAENDDEVLITASSSDVHGGTVTFSLFDNAGGRFKIDASTGVVTVADASLLNYEDATSHNITVRASDGTATVDQVFTIAVTNVAPVILGDSDATANTVLEGAANGTTVGITGYATDVNGGTVTYSLSNDAGGRFAINSSTGVITVANAALLNYEDSISHQVAVHAVDASGASSSDMTFTVFIQNVAPSSAVDTNGASGGTVSEGATNGATVGITASATDVNGGTITYSLADDAGGRFAINASTGVVTVADASQLNYESNTAQTITVHAQDAGALSSSDTQFTINVTNVAPTTPADSNTDANTVSEGASNGATVGITASAGDVHGGTVTYSLADDAGGIFTIDSSTGVVTVANASAINYETATSQSITVRASDGTDFSDRQFTIAVTNVAPVTPVDSDGTVNAVLESVENGMAVGITASSSDVNGGTITYTLSDNAGGRFAIDSSTGVVTVANATLINYETGTSHSITVRASDGTGFTESVFGITVNNVAPSVPVDANAGTNSISEAAVNGATVGITASSADPHGGTVVYSLPDDAGGRFAINSSTGVVTVANAALLDYESAQSHVIVVRASDGNLFSQQSFTIDVTNAPPSAAVDANAATNVVAENAANGATVGLTASSTDPHGGTVTYSLADNAGGRFAINASSGVVTVANGSLLDYEAAHSHNITVRSSDAQNAYTDQVFTINLSDLNDNAPVITTGAAYNVTENTTLVATLASTDVDTVGTNPATFTIVGGADQALFSIVSGKLQFTAAPDYESPVDAGADNNYVVQVRAFDGVNSTFKTITVTVKDANDKTPMIQTPPNQAINEGQTLVVALKAVDPDTVGTIPAQFTVVGGPDKDLFTVVNNNLVFKNAPDRENPLDSDHNNVYLVQVRAYDGVNSSLKMISVTVNDLNDTAPVLNVASPVGVNENTTFVANLTATDPDTVGGPTTYAITGGTDAAFFEIVGGQLKFKAAQDFNTPKDAGADNSYLVQVTSSDGVNSSNKMLTVNVLDLGLHLVGDNNANNMVGSVYDDTFVGNGGNDRMNGKAGNDTIDGSAGIDTAIYAGNKAAYNVVVQSAGHMTVSGPEGNDILTSVERLHFANADVAYDLDGNAGEVVKLLGALFGAPAAQVDEFIGIGLNLADGGMTELQIANLVVTSDIFAALAGSHSNTDFVNYVYHNLTGAYPTPAVRAELVGYLNSHALTQGEMAVLAAESDVNLANIGFMGLVAHGVDYTPV